MVPLLPRGPAPYTLGVAKHLEENAAETPSKTAAEAASAPDADTSTESCVDRDLKTFEPRSQMRPLTNASWALGALALVSACRDFHFVTREEIEQNLAQRGITVDAGNADEVPLGPCGQCGRPLRGGSACDESFRKCESLKGCLESMDCAFPICSEVATQQAITTCALPCVAKSGIKSAEDPATRAIIDYLTCLGVQCSAVCPWVLAP